MKAKEILPLAVLAVVVIPATVNLARRPEPTPTAEPVQLAEPRLPERPETPEAWFEAIRPRCTPAEVRLSTDLNPPPGGWEGVGFKAACYGLARQVASARSLLLSLPEEEQIDGAEILFEVADGLTREGRREVAGPLMELVLEFWPDHPTALYEAGAARFGGGEAAAAREFLERFLEVHGVEDSLAAAARRMMGASVEG